jgi:hypothetical protein
MVPLTRHYNWSFRHGPPVSFLLVSARRTNVVHMSAERKASRHAQEFRWHQINLQLPETEAAIRDLRALKEAVDQLLIEAVIRAHDEGMSSASLAESLGFTKQVAAERPSPEILNPPVARPSGRRGIHFEPMP